MDNIPMTKKRQIDVQELLKKKKKKKRKERFLYLENKYGFSKAVQILSKSKHLPVSIISHNDLMNFIKVGLEYGGYKYAVNLLNTLIYTEHSTYWYACHINEYSVSSVHALCNSRDVELLALYDYKFD